MLSDSEQRRLRGLEHELEQEAPRVAARLRSFGRAWLLFRSALAVLAGTAGMAFLCSGAGWGCALYGVAIVVVSGWEIKRRLHQLRRSSEQSERTSHWR
ncbi:MAG: DUF3040 domain-containing protein [Pseudonocardia sp.]|nr:DUF3040 domain-containing protein [Pseudonocardia sp.]